MDHRSAANTLNECGMLLVLLKSKLRKAKAPAIVQDKIKESIRSLDRLRDELDEWCSKSEDYGYENSPYFE